MLELEDLVQVYPGPVTALEGVTLSVPEGLFGLLGPNGAGKTTLMRAVAGLLEPTAGKVRLDGADVVADPRVAWTRLGYLPQDFGFYPHLSGRDMLLFLLRLKGVEAPHGLKALADELLEAVNLVDHGRRKVRDYSGGMRQRLGIAQAIAGNPRLLVVDEPTAGLDPEERLRFYRLLAELARERIVLLSTHIVEDVAVLCPSFAILRAGRIVCRTSPRAAREALEGALFEGDVDADAIPSLERERRVTRIMLVEGRHRARVLAPEGIAPPGFTSVEPTLEDAYLLAMRDPELFGERLGRPRERTA